MNQSIYRVIGNGSNGIYHHFEKDALVSLIKKDGIGSLYAAVNHIDYQKQYVSDLDLLYLGDVPIVLSHGTKVMYREDDIIRWAEDKNLITGSYPGAQMLKLFEEVGELAGGLAKDNEEAIKDSIGDVLVVIYILSAQLGIPMKECLDQAWNEIKDRKGKMVDGIFIKEGDQ